MCLMGCVSNFFVYACNLSSGVWCGKKLVNRHTQREGYPETRIFCSVVGYVLVQKICFVFCKEFTKFEADRLCQNITHITRVVYGFSLYVQQT